MLTEKKEIDIYADDIFLMTLFYDYRHYKAYYCLMCGKCRKGMIEALRKAGIGIFWVFDMRYLWIYNGFEENKSMDTLGKLLKSLSGEEYVVNTECDCRRYLVIGGELWEDCDGTLRIVTEVMDADKPVWEIRKY